MLVGGQAVTFGEKLQYIARSNRAPVACTASRLPTRHTSPPPVPPLLQLRSSRGLQAVASGRHVRPAGCHGAVLHAGLAWLLHCNAVVAVGLLQCVVDWPAACQAGPPAASIRVIL